MEQGAWSVEHGAWSMEHGARSEEHGARSVERGVGGGEHGAWSVERGAGGRKTRGIGILANEETDLIGWKPMPLFPTLCLSPSSHFLPFTRHRGSAARLLVAPTFLPLTRHSSPVTRHPLPYQKHEFSCV